MDRYWITVEARSAANLNPLEWQKMSAFEQGEVIAQFYERNIRKGWENEKERKHLDAEKDKATGDGGAKRKF